MPSYQPQGVCASRIDFEVDDGGLVHNVGFIQGCPGNALGVARLVEGRPACEVIALLDGLPCGRKQTSCPDQLATALTEYLGTLNKE